VNPVEKFLLIAPVLLFSMVAHEYAHGFAALKQGDNTALMLGRLSWNPLRHIDPVMTILMPIVTFWTTGVAFGGAKPVPVNPRLYRRFRRGDIIVSLAGIATNLALAAVLVPVIMGLGLVARALPALTEPLSLLQLMFLVGITINLILAAFNLMPIPPLDGSHVMKHVLPPAWAWRYQQASRFGFLFLILLVSFWQAPIRAWMAPAFVLNDLALRVAQPFLLISRWTELWLS
jgi:Zn-dependent protease